MSAYTRRLDHRRTYASGYLAIRRPEQPCCLPANTRGRSPGNGRQKAPLAATKGYAGLHFEVLAPQGLRDTLED